LLLCRSRRENGESGTVDYGGVSWCSPDLFGTNGVIWNGENGIVCFGSRKPLGSPFFQRLDAEPGGGIARQHLADADVFGQHLADLWPVWRMMSR
jgi:hypothetical protein